MPRRRLAFLVCAVTTPIGMSGMVHAERPVDLQWVEVATGLSQPVAIAHADDDSGRLFLVEKAGQIRIWDGANILTTPFLDIRSLVESRGYEQGLLGLAFHPEYASNGFFFINFTRPPGGFIDETAVVRRQVSASDPDRADTDPATIFDILAIGQDFTNHNGGNLQFGPVDGYLYIGMGDGGGSGDPNNRGQDLGQLLGKILRIDVDTTSVSSPYEIPEDNPFVGEAGLDEIWARGLRNPWRWSFDRHTGDLYIGDVGQSCREEINFQSAASTGGENYGWDCREGTIPYDGDTGVGDVCTNQPNAGSVCTGELVEPIFDYDRSLGTSVTAGVVYRGKRIGSLQGTYLFADFGSGRIWLARRDGTGNWSIEAWLDTDYGVSTFGEDQDGEIYLADYFTGTIYRLESPSSIFGDTFESGSADSWSAVVP